jgi:hypothetical protein
MATRVPDPKKVIEDFLERDGQLHDSEQESGRFMFYDELEQRTLLLTLPAAIDPARIRKLAPGEFLVCTDLNAADGTRYDLDFVFRTAGRKAGIERILIHAVNGQPRYDRTEEGGAWRSRPVKH